MPLINGTLLRAEFDKAILKIEAIRKDGKVSPELDVAIDMLITLMRVLIAALLEKTTPKTSNNSSIPPSQTDPDETKRSRRKKSKDTPDDRVDGDGLRKVTEEETVTVETCERCGADLSDLEPCGHECRVIYDIIFTFTETRMLCDNLLVRRRQPTWPSAPTGVKGVARTEVGAGFGTLNRDYSLRCWSLKPGKIDPWFKTRGFKCRVNISPTSK